MVVFKFLCLFACFYLVLYGLVVWGCSLWYFFLEFCWFVLCLGGLGFGGCCLVWGGLGLLVCRSVVVGIIYSRRVLFWVCSSLRFQRFACGICVGVCWL